jgi:outer membrane protein assembly factor BamB
VTPIVRGNLVLISAGGGAGCDLIRLTAVGGSFKAEKVYANKNLSVLHGGMVLVGEQVFGATGEARRSKWVCLDFQSGEPVWATEDPKLGRGSLTYADGCLYCFGEYKGLVVLAEASSKKWTVKGQFSLPQVSRLRLPRGGYWTHPVVANGRLYLRDQELLFCYHIREK